jgi:hypothetical protein
MRLLRKEWARDKLGVLLQGGILGIVIGALIFGLIYGTLAW